MSLLFRVGRALGDRLNPVAVKEFRQAVQSWWVVAMLMLFLLINLAIVGGYLTLSSNPETSITGGRDVFTGLVALLMITCMAFVPLYSGIRLLLERSGINADLLFISTITPAAIVRGKYLTAMALTLLIFSACMPFMVLTYLLRGIDLPTIFAALGWGFLMCAVGNALGIFAGCTPGSWFIRGIVYVLVLIILLYFGGATISMIEMAVTYGAWAIGGRLTWGYLGWTLAIELLAIGALHVFSVAMLSPKTSNRMLIPRLYLTTCWVALAVVAVIGNYLEGAAWPTMAWLMVSGIVAIVLLFIVIGERDAWSHRVRRRIPHNLLLRAVAFLFYTGSAGGVAWCATLLLGTVALAHLFAETSIGRSSHNDLCEASNNLAFVFGYVLCYCLTVAALRPVLFRRVPTPSLAVFSLFFGAAVGLVPYLAAFFMERDWWRAAPWYLVGSPFVLSMSNEPAKNVAAMVVVGWLALSLLAAAPWAIGQWRRFTPSRPAPPPPEAVAAAELA